MGPLDKCVRIQYNFDGEAFESKGTGFNLEGDLEKTEGEIYPMPLGDPHLMINHDNSFPAPLVILDTDFAFVLSRTPTLDDKYARKCEAAFRNIGVDNSRFSKTLQGSECPYDFQNTL